MSKAPILVTVYSRLESLYQCIESLKANQLSKESDLYIASDFAGKESDKKIIQEIRDYILTIEGFKSVNPIFRENNLGAFESPVQAISEVINKHGKIIFLEDDIVVSKSFLQFLNDGLDKFEDNNKVYSISGYCPPPAYMTELKNHVMKAPFHCPWGYATWSNRTNIDMNFNPYNEVMKNKTLVKYIAKFAPFMLEALRNDYHNPQLGFTDVRITFQMLIKEMFTIYPALSLTKNIGLNGLGARGAINHELMEQSILNKLDVKDWTFVDNIKFSEAVVSHGTSSSVVNLVLRILYSLNIRELFNPLVSALKFIKNYRRKK